MKDDSRTWSASVKQEILFQSEIISEEILANLFEARRSRNKLVHEGKAVSADTAWKLFYAISSLLKVILNKEHRLDFELDIKRKSIISDLFKPEDESFEDWQSLPDENIIEAALGEEVTINAKLPKSS